MHVVSHFYAKTFDFAYALVQDASIVSRHCGLGE
jgi:hypothetical protein